MAYVSLKFASCRKSNDHCSTSWLTSANLTLASHHTIGSTEAGERSITAVRTAVCEAASAACERLFSIAGLVFSPKVYFEDEQDIFQFQVLTGSLLLVVI